MFRIFLVLCASSLFFTSAAMSNSVFKVDGKTYSESDLFDKYNGQLFDVEQKRYQAYINLASQVYLDSHWAKEGKKTGVKADKARERFLNKKAKVSKEEIDRALKQFGSSPQLKSKTTAEKTKMIKEFLGQQAKAAAEGGILMEARKRGKIQLLMKEPVEKPIELKLAKFDPIRYGPGMDDVTPVKGGCKGDDCITIIEYSGYQCPACQASAEHGARVLSDYKGKVRWIMRDFPLSFHKRGRPTAIAAHCAAKNSPSKYWHFYDHFYTSKKGDKLTDASIAALGKKVGLNMKTFNKCLKSSAAAKIVEDNFQSGQGYGISGTPSFFIDGFKKGGVTSYGAFKQIIDKQLAAKAKHAKKPAKG